MNVFKLLLLSLFLFALPLSAETIDVKVSNSSDDAEESVSTGNMYLDSSDLELVHDSHNSAGIQAVGMRFVNISIPNGSTIVNAYIQFTVDEATSGNTNVVIYGENIDNALTFSTVAGNISGRTKTSAFVPWNIPVWNNIGDSSADQRTPEIVNIIQNIIDRSGWNSGNDMVLILEAGDGCIDDQCRRTAESYDGSTSSQPLLHIDFALPLSPPVMEDIPDQIVHQDNPYTLDLSMYVTLTDGDPILNYTLTGNLPNGLNFDTSTGIISGIPNGLVSETVSVTATDKDGESNTASFKIIVIEDPLILNFKMDECFWVNNSSVPGNVKNSTVYNLDATSSGNAKIVSNTLIPPLCNYGSFTAQADLVAVDNPIAGNTSGSMTVSFWMKAEEDFGKYAVILTKSKAYDWNDGWGFVNPRSQSSNRLRFYINRWNKTNVTIEVLPSDGWVHIVGTYDQNNLILYKNGVEQGRDNDTATITNSADPLRMGFDNPNDSEYIGGLDEVKFWNVALSASEIKTIFDNESTGKNYNGIDRTCNTCTASIAENSWELIGIPTDSRNGSVGVQDVFDNDFNGSKYDAGADGGWILWKRDYNKTNNNGTYIKVDYDANESVDFGEAYWLGSTRAVDWDVKDLPFVNYNASQCGNMPSSSCVAIAMNVPSSDGITDGSGTYRYNMTGFIGQTPVDWKDCRFDINGTIYTPSEANDLGYINKTIWQYGGGLGSGSGGQVKSTDYSSCDDVTPGGCKLLPYHGFWIELNAALVGATVNLLVPGTSSSSLNSIAITPVTQSAPVGVDIQYTAIATYADGSTYDVTDFVAWHSSNTAAATISSSGTTFGLAHTDASGSSTITASYNGITSNSADLTVTTATLSSLQITPIDATITRGTKEYFTATATYSDLTTVDVTSQATWSSSDTNILTIVSGGTQAGAAEGLTAGSANISAVFDAQTSNTATVEVINASLQSIVVEPIQKSSAVGVKIPYSATGHYSDNSVHDITSMVTWTSSDESKATITVNGVVTTLASGATDIGATHNATSSTVVSLTVTSAQLQSIQITPSNLIEPANTSGRLIATAFYDDGSSQNVTTTVAWSSSNEVVFTVDTSGIANLLSEGIETATATIGAISNAISVTVTDAKLESIHIIPVLETLAVGTTHRYEAVGVFSDGSYTFLNHDVTWSVEESTVASVDANGVVTTLSNGSTKVTASHDGKTGNALLNVTTATIIGIHVIPEGELVEPVGTSGQLYAIATLSDGTTQNVTLDATWISANADAVFVSNGTRPGFTQLLLETPPVLVSATLGTVTGGISIEVIAATLLEIQVSPLEEELPNGLTLQYSAKGVYDNGQITPIDDDVVWSSTNTTIATIEQTGLAQAIIVGDVNISASFEGVTAQTPLYVTTATILRLEITPRSLVEPAGTSGQLTATAIYSDASTENVTTQVTWKSTDSLIASVVTGSVDAGLLHLLSVGDANISATLETSVTRSTASELKSDSISVKVVAATLERISVEPIYESIAKGSTVQYSAIGHFSDGTQTPIHENVSWSSANTSARITEQGLATGENVGLTMITATYDPDPSKFSSVPLNVTTAELLRLELEPQNGVTNIDGTLQFNCLALLTDGSVLEVNDHVIWNSIDESVAIVENGLATGKKVDTTDITASWHNPDTGANYSATASLEVINATLTEVIVYADNPRIQIDGSTQFTAVGIYVNGGEQIAMDITEDAIWSTYDNTIASVSNVTGEKGIVTGHAVGETNTTASLDGLSDTTPIIVTDAQLQSITVEPSTATVALGLTKHFTAIGHYDDGSSIDITTEVAWSSSNEVVAKVESTGRAVSLSVGTSTISASSHDSLGAVVTSNSATLTVSDSTNITLRIEPLNPSIAPVSEQAFRAILTVDGVDDDITDACVWSSSDITVATVSNNIKTAGIATSFDVDSTLTTEIKAIYKHRPNDQNYDANTTLTVLGDLTNQPSSVRIEPIAPTVAENGTLQLSLIGVWDAADGGPHEQNLTTESQTTWKVTDKQIVNINQDGLAEGKKTGTTGIESKYKGIPVTETLTVTTP